MSRRPLVVAALSIAAVGALAILRPGLAQPLVRAIPGKAIPGVLEIKVFPTAVLDGEPIRLGPGARIRDLDNRIVTPGSVSGAHRVVYTTDAGGFIQEVWLVTEAEFRAARNARKGK